MDFYAKIKADAAQYAPSVTDAQAAATAINNAPPVTLRTGYYLSARTILGIVQDPARLEAIVAGIKAAYPTTYTILTQPGQTDGSAGGLDNQAAGTIAFVESLIDPGPVNGVPATGKVLASEAAAMLALGSTTVGYPIATYGQLVQAADVLTAWRQP